jgi:ankyrin repeat protein
MYYLKKVFYLFVLIGFSVSHAGSYEDFFQALAHDNVPVVQGLLARGFDPNSVNPEGQYALVLAVRQSALGVAKVLVANPATQVEVRTAKDESPLMLAAIKGHLDLCRQLIARDADVNKTGWTPLHYAASGGNAKVVRLLLEHFAYIDAESPNGSTPLMMAALYGTTETVKALLDAGADANLKNALGLTALDFARKGQREESVALLLKAVKAIKSDGSW